jgi:hypothetical protein
MTVGFDLDGTLDKPALRNLCNALLKAGHEVHIITGIFREAGDWQSSGAKHDKLDALGIAHEVHDNIGGESIVMLYGPEGPRAILHTLYAVKETFPLDYRLRDLGLRKGALSQKLGLDLFFDDSETYMKMMPCMDGNVTLLHVQ